MSRQKNLKRNLLICLLAGSAVMYTLPLHAATSVVANNALPQGGQFFNGKEFVAGSVIDNNKQQFTGIDGNVIGSIAKPNDLTMNVHQANQNAVIKWGSFDVGGSATVNFTSNASNFNTLNYVNSGSASQIYGTINGLGGNIYVVNTAGVQIWPSAQINVGSLYVSNKNLDNVNWEAINNVNPDINSIMGQGATGDAALMSLGNINANKVTFEGDGRIVIDSERIKNADGNKKLDYQNINIKTADDNTGNVIIGYEAYDETNKTYKDANADGKGNEIATVNGNAYTKADGYMWVEDVEQLQAINTNLGGNYALRNSIDATSTSGWGDSEHDTNNEGFLSIGIGDTGKVTETDINNETKYGFYGNFDGIDYNIFGLTINREDTNNVGLFGVTHDANISNVTLVGGSITGQNVVGSVVGAALGSTHITNATNSASVTGTTDVGGIVGASRNERISDGDNGTISVDTNAVFTDLVNTGTIKGTDFKDNVTDTSISNTGGLIGYMHNGTLKGNSYNLGDVSSEGHNVGGLVGYAVNSTIGNPSVVNGKPVENVQVVYNRLDVEGAYNVGGIVGNMEGTTVQNAENSGNVTASGYTTDKYIYYSAYQNVDDGTAEDIGNDRYKITVNVNAANVGGIAGTSSDSSTIENVANTGDVNSRTDTYEQYGTNHIYYTAGNVGGVVGRAEDTNITNATNRENEVRGAHNVGGVAGYFGGEGTVNGGINDGGDIMATGARFGNDFMTEHVRSSDTGDETFIIGNIGGVVGYMDGDNVYVTGSANRGTVHSQDIDDPQNVLYTSQAANTGGVVGRINRSDTKTLAEIQNEADKKEAAVNNSYNTGDVRGYAGVGGVVGMMYNGEVANSYNLGAINTTRRPQGGNKTSVNMGGVVGDATEESNAKAIIYNVYNKGQIGDETYNFYARHVGGVVGRLSGTVDKAYNTGAIYNGYSVVGGIAGWFYEGTISNSFNTGNITVLNKETAEKAGSQVGGIAGGMSAYGNNGTNFIYNAYNLGTLRSFNTGNLNNPNSVGGIVGKLVGGGGADTNVSIRNVYTTSNIYSGTDGENAIKDSGAGSIYGDDGGIGGYLNLAGANYIELGNSVFNNLEKTNANVKKINYNDRYNSTAYNFVELNTGDKIWADVNGANVSEDGYWRIYKNGDGTGTTPILNAFLPNAEDYFSGETDAENPMEGISSIQYGTAYDPLLTIIKANEDLTFDWGALGIQNDGGLAVYNAGLTLTDFKANGGTGYFGGIIYADESLNLNGTDDIGLGSASQIYGSDVAITTDGKVTIYGDITATGNQNDSNTTGGITINAGDVDVYGTLTSAKGGVPTKVSGIAQGAVAGFDFGDIKDKDKAVTDIGNRFAVDVTSSVTGNITINAGTKIVTGDDGKSETVTIGDGNVNLYYGNKEEGLITAGGDLNVTGTGDVYVDSDLDIDGNLTLTGNGANSEVVLDLTNIGQVQAKNGTVNDAVTGLHNFMHHFSNTAGGGVQAGNKIISLNSASGDSKITVDMWDYENDKFDLKKYDETTASGHTFRDELNNLNLKVDNTGVAEDKVKDHIYIWVSDGEQLQGINATASDDGLDFNYALKGDINASDVTGYEAIGGTTGFTGTFDGRGNRIIGLTVNATDTTNNKTNAGIFSTVGEGGVVKNVNIYSGNFTGSDNAGAVAGVNNGRIENIVTSGNTVTANGSANSEVIDNKNVGAAGGIAGINNGYIDDVETTGSVIAGDATDNSGALSTAGGIVGINNAGATVNNSFSDSAATANANTNTNTNTTYALGGVVGVNKGEVQLVDSLGVTNGGSTGSSNVGGVIGINKGNMYSGYNESIVSGSSNVGGIIGSNSSAVANVVNATSVTGKDKDDTDISEYVGGLVGTNSGSVTNGRNNGTITGTDYVGGMVGNNADGSTLTNLVNDSSAAITGEKYVGGIAGKNDGIITANNSNLINRGSITGNQYVGGVAGMNTGEISNTVNSVVLNATGNNAKYFGGVAGYNDGIIGTVTNTSAIDVTAQYGTLVGGIIGYNAANGTLEGEIVNEGNISGDSEVGGIIGENINQSILNNENKPRLTISNKGNVSATDGGAAGIFYDNKGAINNVDLINEGTVTGGTAKDSVTGGLFGKNSGKVTNSTLTNSGIVTGGGTVGGLIGNNSGNISTSSLINEAGATVIGTNNVGGLIGVNTGTITGGRNEQEVDKDGNVTVAADSYYKYQIYNNGVINVGTWTDANGNGIVDAGEIQGLAEGVTSTNIGGLIGKNETTGSLTAGYNTGVINAGSSSNVGGIVGNNEGIVDQIFNTVMTGVDDKGNTVYGAITGKDNVGGLVGTNSGELKNAYNTTDVEGAKGSTGNAVGVNTNKVENIYGYSELVGNGNEATNSYVINNSDEWKQQEKYIGFDFTTSDNTPAVWKNYDGYSNPLLKVFLTKAEYTGNEDFTYNATDQGLTIDSTTITAADKLDAYNNADSLLTATQNKNAGKDYLGIYSQQIAASGKGDTFDPNNLGYDIDVTYDIEKAQINISLDEINRVYGNATISNDTQNSIKNEFGYGFTYEIENINDTMREELVNNGIVFEQTYDGAVYGVSGNKVTNDAGKYTWSADFVLNNDNYEFTNSKQEITIDGGISTVKRAEITVDLNEVIRDYGNTAIKNNGGNYTANINGLVNGDNELGYTSDDLNITVTSDGALTGNSSGKVTGDAGDHIWTAEVTGKDGQTLTNLSKNYNITVNGSGKSTVNKVNLTVDLNEVIRDYGNTAIKNNGGNYTASINGLVNGDNELGYTSDDLNITVTSDGALTGNSSGKVTGDAGDHIWTAEVTGKDGQTLTNLSKNYKITVKDSGKSTINKAQITIGADNEAIHVGEKPDYIGTDINDGLVNGDKLNGDYHYGVADSADEKVVGDHSIGVWIGNTFYDLSATVDWTKVDGFFSNYEVTYNPGTLTVTEQVMPDLPDNWPNNRWDYLFGDNPFDRNENFRERKAEVNFVDGAMEI